MKNKLSLANLNLWFYTTLTTTIALIIGLVLLNPLWAKFSPPFPIPKVLPAITAPVDGPFYLWNAEYGYDWNPNDRLSLWFHPLVSYLIRFMPKWFPLNIWFWIISVAFAIGSIPLTMQLASLLGLGKVSTKLVLLILLIPGGLEIATGNVEIPTLFFALALMLSVLHWQKWWLTLLCAALAILTKPNALYMIPVLLVYFVSGVLERNKLLWAQALIGMITLLLVWLMWISFVDWKVGVPGAYWHLRELTGQYTAQDVQGFFNYLAKSFLYNNDMRDRIRYSVALIIPIVNLWLIGLAPIPHERDKYALAAGNMTMLAIALYMGNPNKIIVYTTTLPGYFVVHILFFERLITRASFKSFFFQFTIFALYVAYCVAMLLVYILGTPLGWYY